jgi:stage III sporulation protein AD
MDIIKIIGVGFVTLIISIMLKEYRKDFAIYASLVGGAIILYFAIDYLKSIVNFLDSLSSTGISRDFILLLVKITGISILTEFAVSICKDMGESAIANKVDLGGKLLVISLSIPVISATLSGLLKLLQ